MKIIEHNWKWRTGLTRRNGAPRFIIIHNQGGDGTAAAVHAYHLSIGYQGFAYHYQIDLSGDIHRGRPEAMMGGHTLNYNDCIGVQFQGNYDTRKTMPAAQMAAGLELVAYLRDKYQVPVKGHKQMPGNSTSCPGKHFPLEMVAKAEAKPAAPKVNNLKLKQAMMQYALLSGIRVTGWERITILSPGWGKHAQKLAWRVSTRIHETDPKVPHSTRPTPELYAVLLPKK